MEIASSPALERARLWSSSGLVDVPGTRAADRGTTRSLRPGRIWSAGAEKEPPMPFELGWRSACRRPDAPKRAAEIDACTVRAVAPHAAWSHLGATFGQPVRGAASVTRSAVQESVCTAAPSGVALSSALRATSAPAECATTTRGVSEQEAYPFARPWTPRKISPSHRAWRSTSTG